MDFLGAIHGLRSFEGARKRSAAIDVAGHPLLVLSLEDILKSKTAANRDKDRAVLPTLKATLRATQAKNEANRQRRRK